jgi:hypothetical protein
LANVLFADLQELVAAFRHGAHYLTADRSRVSFMFNDDDLTKQKHRVTRRKAA